MTGIMGFYTAERTAFHPIKDIGDLDFGSVRSRAMAKLQIEEACVFGHDYVKYS